MTVVIKVCAGVLTTYPPSPILAKKLNQRVRGHRDAVHWLGRLNLFPLELRLVQLAV